VGSDVTFDDPFELGFELIQAGVTPAPPREPIYAHVANPIALDVHDGFAAR
jgi:hypothetical protein